MGGFSIITFNNLAKAFRIQDPGFLNIFCKEVKINNIFVV